MKVIAQLQNPDQVEITLTITMSLAGWREVATTLFTGRTYVNQQFREAIQHVIVGLEARIEDEALTMEAEPPPPSESRPQWT
jgi:hypothetical protein